MGEQFRSLFSLRKGQYDVKLSTIFNIQLAIALDRRAKRIYPEMPIGEEREQMRQEFMKKYKKPTVHVGKE